MTIRGYLEGLMAWKKIIFVSEEIKKKSEIRKEGGEIKMHTIYIF